MDFKVGVEGTYGCAGFRGELRIHIISHMMHDACRSDRRDNCQIRNSKYSTWSR